MQTVSQYAHTRYPNLCNALDPEPKQPETMLEMIQRKGLKDPKPRSVKYYNRLHARRADRPKQFPMDADFQHRILIERQSPLFHFEAPDCIGDTPQFSSRGLTDWYVAEFCKLNHLKG